MVVLGIDLGTVWTKAALFIDTEKGHHLIPLKLDIDAATEYGDVGNVMQSALFFKGRQNFVKPDGISSDVTYMVYRFDVGQKAINNMYSFRNSDFFFERIKPGIYEDEELTAIDDGFKTYMLAAAVIYYITEVALVTLHGIDPSLDRIDKYVFSVPATTREGDQRWKNLRDALSVPYSKALNNQIRINEEDITILREPEAAGYYLLQSHPSENGKYFLVYDFGGGTFDCSILKSKGNLVLLKDSAEHSSVGKNQLGGNDIDQLIREELYRQNPGLPQELVSLNESLSAADKAKLETLRNEIYHLPKRVKLALARKDSYHENTLFGFQITREKFESLIKRHLSTSIACCDDLLSSNGLAWKDLSGIIMVGGTSRIPLVKRMVEDHIRHECPDCYDSIKIILEDGGNGISAVAYGCATYHHLKPSADSLLDQGIKEMEQSNFSDAEFFFAKAEEAGHKNAPFYLGMLHYLGLSPDDDGVNYRLALRYFEKENTPYALFQRAVCFIKGQGVQRNEAQAKHLINQVPGDDYHITCFKNVLSGCASNLDYEFFYTPGFSLIMEAPEHALSDSIASVMGSLRYTIITGLLKSLLYG